jgi:extracellular elastinolytic metalloproteinase
MKQTFVTSLLLLMLTVGVYAQSSRALSIANQYLQQNKERLHLTDADIASYLVTDEYTPNDKKLTHLYLQQTVQNIPIYNALVNFSIQPDGSVLYVGNRFVYNAAARINTTTPSISVEQAIAKAASDVNLSIQQVQLVRATNHFTQEYRCEGVANGRITVKKLFEATKQGNLKLVYEVSMVELGHHHAWRVSVDALTGSILSKKDRVIACTFHRDSRINTNSKGASGECTLHSDVTPARKHTQATASYRAYPLGVESPSHGARVLLEDPQDPMASPFGWHDTNGANGAEYTITRGNNCHAYQDRNNADQSTGDEPNGGASLLFDFPYSAAAQTPIVHEEAAVTNVFVWSNFSHDVWYHYGFDEPSGNFQQNNYGHGGIGQDPVLSEAQDGSGTDNANFYPPVEGESGVMQMYLWNVSGNASLNLNITAPAGVAGSYTAAAAQFGAAATSLSGSIVLVNDGTAPTTDACSAIANISGKVALIDRGTCEFGAKCLTAQNAGAIGAIICNNVAGAPVSMPAGASGGSVTIPCIMISQSDCALLRTAMGLTGNVSESGNLTGIDGDFDNGVIAHEYGHGVSTRLTGGPSNSDCLGNYEQMGEGWSDWMALVLTSKSSDTGGAKRGIGTFVIGESPSGDGIRNYPYSTSLAINPQHYSNIASATPPHGVGEIWCATIWDLYWNFIDLYGFDPNMYTGTGGNNKCMKLVIEAMKIQPCSPGFLDGRDAILAADQAYFGGNHKCMIWETFARRGMGYSAVQGSSDSNGDQVEGYDVTPACNATLQLQKTAQATVEAGDTITYQFSIWNNTVNALSNVTLTDAIPAGTTFVAGSLNCNGTVNGNDITIQIGSMPSAQTLTCQFSVVADPANFSEITYRDDIEGSANWTPSGTGTSPWQLLNNSTKAHSGSKSWYVPDTQTSSDQYLTISAPLNVAGATPILSFWHNYKTEATWDGGVVEISTNGSNWSDLGNQMLQNGYNGTIQTNPDSPISARNAFTGNSNGYKETLIDLSQWNGQTVFIRFRLGCDAYVGDEGWYVDDIQLYTKIVKIPNEACISADGGNSICASVANGGTLILEPQAPVNVLTLPANTFTIAPNPTNQYLHITANQPNLRATAYLLSVNGQQLHTQSLTTTSTVISLTDYPSGVYILRIETPQGVLTDKIIKL